MRTTDELILEQIYQKTLKNRFLITEDVESKLPTLLKQFRNLDEVDIRALADMDPTENKAVYLPWITKLASRGVIKYPEDTEKVKETLAQFEQQKVAPDFQGSKDINSYKTYGDLAKTIELNQGKTSKGLAKKISTEQGIEHIYQDSNFMIYKISTQEGASKLCRNTKWCIKDPKYGSFYLQKGPLFMIVKNNEPYVLMHFETGSIKDAYDKSIDKSIANEIRYLVEQFPQYKKIGETVETDPKSIKRIQRAMIDYIDIRVMAEYIEMEVEGLLGNYNEAKTTTIYDIVYHAADGLFEAAIEMLSDDPESNDMTDADIRALNYMAGDFSIFSNQKENFKQKILEQQVKNYFDSNKQ
jgi:hypothetical protein